MPHADEGFRGDIPRHCHPRAIPGGMRHRPGRPGRSLHAALDQHPLRARPLVRNRLRDDWSVIPKMESRDSRATYQLEKRGWDHIDRKSHAFRCLWFPRMRPSNQNLQNPLVAKICSTPTSALHYNGNIARSWKKEDFSSEEVSYGTWVLREQGKVRAVLTVDVIPRIRPALDMDFSTIKYEPGVRGSIRDLHEWIAENDLDYRIPNCYRPVV